MAQRLLQLDDVRHIDSPQNVASLFQKIGYNASAQQLAIDDLELPARSAEAIWNAYMIADHQHGNESLQVLLFQLQENEWLSPTVASNRMRTLAQSLCRRPSNFLLLGTKNYNQLMLVNPRKSFDADLNLKVSIRKLLIDRVNPTPYDYDCLEAIAARNLSPQELYKVQCEAFDVEKLTKEFYRGYREIFEELQRVIKANNPHSYFTDPNRLHQFSQRLLGRVMFLYFLQKKEFLAGDRNFLKNQYNKLCSDLENKNFYHQVLERLFFEMLNKQRPDMDSPWGKIPYLNGGLFERDYGLDVIDTAGVKTPPHIELPNSVFDPSGDKGILRFFNSYNFTVSENVQGDEDVAAVDPEMLGKVFENMLAAEERGQSGTFYTPRGIVQFMCVESLSRYLADSTGMDLEAVKKLTEYDSELPGQDINQLLTREQARKLKQALDSVRICDPAVGSGAFPMGMMQVILSVKQAIAHLMDGRPVQRGSFTISQWKRDIIANNLYGVDIKPEAVEIAKLRMWLSLVVDIPTIDKVDPLPNLDYKLMCGDSLISTIQGEQLIPPPQNIPTIPTKKKKGEFETPRGDQLMIESVTPIQIAIQPLLDLQRRYFDAQAEERHQLREQILAIEANVFRVAVEDRYQFWVSKQQELKRKIKAMNGKVSKAQEKEQSQITEKLAELNKFAAEVEKGMRSLNFFQWHLHFNEVFQEKGGFDIVIGNPPWGAKLSKEDKGILKEEYPDVDSSTPNSFAYFLGLAIKISKKRIAFVLPDSILVKDFAELRTLIMPNVSIIQWFQNIGMPSDLRPFYNVEHDVCVLLLDTDKTQETLCKITYYSPESGEIEVKEWIGNKSEFILKEFDNAYNLMLSKADVDILQKINKHKKISEYMQCHEGIHTGNARDILFKQNRENQFCKPLFYGANAGDLINNWLSLRSGWHVDYRKEIVNKGKGYYASLRDEQIFTLPKIYITRTGKPFKAFLDCNSIYASNNFFSLQFLDYSQNNIEELKVILPFILSKISQYFIRTFAAPRLCNTFIETKIIHLLKFRIPDLNAKQKEQILNLVNQIYKILENDDDFTSPDMQKEIKQIEKTIDLLIYQIYDLTEDEVAIIENAV